MAKEKQWVWIFFVQGKDPRCPAGCCRGEALGEAYDQEPHLTATHGRWGSRILNGALGVFVILNGALGIFVKPL